MNDSAPGVIMVTRIVRNHGVYSRRSALAFRVNLDVHGFKCLAQPGTAEHKARGAIQNARKHMHMYSYKQNDIVYNTRTPLRLWSQC